MKTHKIKILPQYYEAVKKGIKTFELRYNDRYYEVGDKVILQEIYEKWTIGTDEPEYEWGYTGEEITAKITYILNVDELDGRYAGWVIFSFVKEEEK